MAREKERDSQQDDPAVGSNDPVETWEDLPTLEVLTPRVGGSRCLFSPKLEVVAFLLVQMRNKCLSMYTENKKELGHKLGFPSEDQRIVYFWA